MKTIFLIISVFFLFSCKGAKVDTATDSATYTETAQQVGDAMASVDENGGTSGNISFLPNAARKTFARLAPNEMEENQFIKLLLPEAQATACSATAFGTCSGQTMTRNLNGCSVGTATFTGSVTVTWAGTGVTTCALANFNNTITRVPSFTVQGRRGATLEVSKSGSVGQVMTWASGLGFNKVFNFSNDGTRRKFTDSVGNITYDHTTMTTSPISIAGNQRSGRVMSGGTLQVKNNLTNVTCNFSPVNVTWASATCNCPTQGTWQGTCSDNKAVTIVLNGCGTANYSEGSDSTAMTFDRCGI